MATKGRSNKTLASIYATNFVKTHNLIISGKAFLPNSTIANRLETNYLTVNKNLKIQDATLEIINKNGKSNLISVQALIDNLNAKYATINNLNTDNLQVANTALVIKNIITKAKSNPKIGIGTSNPQTNLDIKGDVAISGDIEIEGALNLPSLSNGIAQINNGVLTSGSLENNDIADNTIQDNKLTSNPTSTNIIDTIVKRDSSGDFSANNITANLIGNAQTSDKSTNFTGSLAGDVTGTQDNTKVSFVGPDNNKKSNTEVADSVDLTQNKSSNNNPNSLVFRDNSGSFSSNVINSNTINSSNININQTGSTPALEINSGDTNINGTLNINSTANFNSIVNFKDNITGQPKNVLLVTTGAIRANNEFNTITDALNSITDASSINRYTILVGPGVFTEPDTLQMKSYVTLTGSAYLSTVIKINNPQKNIIIGANDSAIINLYLEGATDNSLGNQPSAITFTGAGTFYVRNCKFGNNYKIFNQSNSSYPGTQILASYCSIDTNAIVTQIVELSDNGSSPSVMILSNFLYTPNANIVTGITDAFYIHGQYSNFTAKGMALSFINNYGSGNAFKITEGATFQLTSARISYFDRGIYIPATDVLSPKIRVSSVYFNNNNIKDIQIDNGNTSGFISALMSPTNSLINTDAKVAIFFIDSTATNKQIFTVGELITGETIDSATNITPLINKSNNVGLISGGDLSIASGTNVNVSEGFGYIEIDNNLKLISWNAGTISLNLGNNFIYIDKNGLIQSNASEPDIISNIILGKAAAGPNIILFIQKESKDNTHTGTRLDSSWRNALGPIYISGSTVVKNTTTTLTVGSGTYVFGTHVYKPSGGTPISFTSFYRNGTSFAASPNQTNIDYQNYDNGNGLTAIPSGNFSKHTLFVVGEEDTEKYLLVYGQNTYTSLTDANSATLPIPPLAFEGNIALIASIIVQNTTNTLAQISQIKDERPRPGYAASAISQSELHGNLLGLLSDDHPQYVLTNGNRVITGNLQLGGNDITGANLINNVKIESHASRHQPGGPDAIPTAIPVDIGTTNVTGISTSLSRADHVHAHGNQPGGSLHSTVTTTIDGFMSSEDKVKLDNIYTENFVLKTGDTMTGTLTLSPTSGSALIVNGAVTISDFPIGIIHSDSSGNLSSSLIINSDITDNTIADSKLASSPTSSNTASTIVKRDTSGSFSANTVTANLVGNVVGNVTGESSDNVLKSGDTMTGTLILNPAIGNALIVNGTAGSNALNLNPESTSNGLVIENTTGNAIEVNSDQFTVIGSSGNTNIAGTLSVGGIVTLSDLSTTGVLHSDSTGKLTSSLIVRTYPKNVNNENSA